MNIFEYLTIMENINIIYNVKYNNGGITKKERKRLLKEYEENAIKRVFFI